jgi:hypothetical protein
MFQRRGIWQFYQPLRSGGVKQRSTETGDSTHAKRIVKCVTDLALDHRWAVLDAIAWPPCGICYAATRGSSGCSPRPGDAVNWHLTTPGRALSSE